jgi:hypoxanthine phosphoribosyltransferase
MKREIIQIEDLYFEPFISEKDLQDRVKEMATELDNMIQDQNVVFLGVLNGCFVFMADLIRQCSCNQEVRFVKISSYSGIQSTGNIVAESGLNDELVGKNIVVIEDIIDTGLTVKWLIEKLNELQVKSIKVVTLLFKPEALQHKVDIDLIGFQIPNNFVVGYGLDYNGKGRNIKSIFTLSDVHKI